MFTKYGCAVCHSLDGKEIYGPPLNDIYLKEVKVIRQDREITVAADREYLKRSILDPGFEEVLGFQNKAMPKAHFSDEEADILVDYLIAVDKEDLIHE